MAPFVAAMTTIPAMIDPGFVFGSLVGVFGLTLLAMGLILRFHISNRAEFLFPPVVKLHWLGFWKSKGTVLAMLSLVLMCTQLLSFSMPPKTFPPAVDNVAQVFFDVSVLSFKFPGLSAESYMYIEFVVSMVLAACWVGMAFLASLAQMFGFDYLLTLLTSLSLPANMLANAFYLAILPKLLQFIDCDFTNKLFVFPPGSDPSAPGIYATPCYGTEHQFYAAFSLVCMMAYCLSSMMMSPFFMLDLTQRTEIVFAPVYVLTDRMLKTVVVAAKVFFGTRQRFQESWYIYMTAVVILCAWDAYYLWLHGKRGSVCSFEVIGKIKALLSAMIGWAGIMSMIARGALDPRERTENWGPFIGIILGWMVIIGFGLYRKKQNSCRGHVEADNVGDIEMAGIGK